MHTIAGMLHEIECVHARVVGMGRSPFAVTTGDDWSRFEHYRRGLRQYTAAAAKLPAPASDWARPTLHAAWVYLVALAHELAGQGLDDTELDALELVPVDRLDDEIEYLADYSG